MTGIDDAGAGGQLADGMNLSIRLRRDFTVTDAGRLLTAARRMYRELNPGTSTDDAEAMVSCAADALYVVLDHAGLIGDAVDDRLTAYRGDGLDGGGWRLTVLRGRTPSATPGSFEAGVIQARDHLRAGPAA